MSVFDWIKMARDLDAEGLEMYEGFFTSLDDAYIDSVGDAIRAAGFAMPMLCCSPDFTQPNAAARARAVEHEADMIRVARRLGGPGCVCRVLSGQRRPEITLQEGIEWVVASIEQLLPVAREYDVVLGMENHYKDGFWRFPEFAQKKDVFLKIINAIPDRKHFGVQYDPSNAIVAGDDPVELLEIVGDRVVSMHASDRWLSDGATLDELRQTDGTLGYSPKLQHGVVGKGLNNYPAIFGLLAKHRYSGWISIEDGMNGMGEMAESLAYLRRMRERFFFMNPVRTALIGCGKVGGLHLAALTALPESKLVAVCDSSSERAERFAARQDARAYTDVGRLVRESGAEAVFICTPHPLHAEPAVLAAEAGLHVMVEKPMAAKLSDCDAMMRAAQRSGVTLSVMSQRRFYEPVQRIKAAIAAGKIGRPVLGVFLMFSWRDQAYYQSDPWRGKWETEGGGVLVNQSPHQLDLLRWFMGDVEEISGAWANLNHPYVEVDDTAVATLRFKGGGLGSIVTSLSQKPGLFTKVHVHGSNGASLGVETDRGATFIAGVSGIPEPPLNDLWTIPGEEHLLSDFEREDRARFESIDPTLHYHAAQIKEFLQALRTGREPLVTAEDGRAVVEMFCAIYESNRTKRAVRLRRGRGWGRNKVQFADD